MNADARGYREKQMTVLHPAKSAFIGVHPRFLSQAWFQIGFLGLVFLVGCGRSGPEMVTVSGTVTFEGRPVQEGRIRFRPAEGTRATVTGADIRDGKYTVTNKGGVPVGTHRVEIEALRARPGAGGGADIPGAPATSVQQYIPARYNKQTELTITIEPGSGAVTKDFALTK